MSLRRFFIMILCLGTTPTVQRTMTFAALKIDAVNRAADVKQSASGKSLNVARVLKTLDQSLIATGFLGGDAARIMRRDLDRASIAHDFVDVEPETRTCITVIDQGGATATELIEESKPLSDGDWTAMLEKVAQLLGECRVMVMSGSLPPKAPQGFYGDCANLATKVGVTTILDTRGEPLRQALSAHPNIIKLNLAEFEETFGVRGMPTVEWLRSAEMQQLIITHGGEATLVWDGTNAWRITTPKIDVVSPIGSGDSFAAGVAAGIMKGQPLHEAARLGAACGAANALTPVAGFVRREDVERLLREIQVSRDD
ncbi:MAG TPA: 1-phosphofructokinase family hexose kinase [Tepidisphaeraceae bacterium]|jgi:tagatose 6-phosphate kinase|nr:1-phosphofructokinase family hexose kinase [Tepidisphaeraceae bacterium]